MIAADTLAEKTDDNAKNYQKWQNQREKLQKKIESQRPLVNLVDNLVKYKEEQSGISSSESSNTVQFSYHGNHHLCGYLYL